MFCLCRVGNDESAARSLKELNTANGTKDLIFYGEDPIDNKLQGVGGDIDTYVGVVCFISPICIWDMLTGIDYLRLDQGYGSPDYSVGCLICRVE